VWNYLISRHIQHADMETNELEVVVCQAYFLMTHMTYINCFSTFLFSVDVVFGIR